ncbi:MAG: NAD(P)-dependent alcohol dehydrogenase [Polyangiales bacterium]
MFAATSPSAAEPLRLVELPQRPLRFDEVRVKVRAVGVNPVDWKMRGFGSPLGLAQRLLGPRGPLVVGTDFAGEVVEVGASLGGTKPGLRVVGGTDFSRGQRGSYADEVVVRTDQFAALPDGVRFEDAACLPVPGVTAWRALTEVGGLREKRGARVLVLGAAGGVGLMAVQLARSLGASAVGVCSARNAALVGAMGAEVVDYGAGDALAAARAKGPYALVLNAVGSDAYPVGACRALLTPTGAVCLVAARPHDYPSLVAYGNVRAVLGRPTRALLEPLVAALAKGELKVTIEATLPLAEAEEAHRRSRTGKVVGKIVLLP